MDVPRIDKFQGRDILTAHLVSTLPGAEGTEELVAFALSIGMRRSWIQYEGTHREHFDLMGVKCAEAARAGAVTGRVGHVLVAKRDGRCYTPPGA
jgi:hypothetical protein